MEPLKSFESYIYSLVEPLPFEFFHPTKTQKEYRADFEKFFLSESTFWSKIDAHGGWSENWFFIELKSSGKWDRVRVGFNVRESEIRLVAFDQIVGSNFSKTYEELSVRFFNCWVDHNHFNKNIVSFLLKGLHFSNRAKPDTQYGVLNG